MLRRFRPSFLELLHLGLALLMAYSQWGHITDPMDYDWVFLVLPPLFITSIMLTCHGVIRLVNKR